MSDFEIWWSSAFGAKITDLAINITLKEVAFKAWSAAKCSERAERFIIKHDIEGFVSGEDTYTGNKEDAMFFESKDIAISWIAEPEEYVIKVSVSVEVIND